MKKAAILTIVTLFLAGTASADIVITDFDDDDSPVTYYDQDDNVFAGNASSVYADFTDGVTGNSTRVTITDDAGDLDLAFTNELGTTGVWNEGENLYFSFDKPVQLVSWQVNGHSNSSTDFYNVSSADPDVKSETFTGNGPHTFTIDGTYSGILDAGTLLEFENDPQSTAAAFHTLTVEVLAGAAPIPEPITMLGLFVGAGGIATYMRRRKMRGVKTLLTIAVALGLAGAAQAKTSIWDFDDGDATPTTYYKGSAPAEEFTHNSDSELFGDFTDPDTGVDFRVTITNRGGNNIEIPFAGIQLSDQTYDIVFDADVKLLEAQFDRYGGSDTNTWSSDDLGSDYTYTAGDPQPYDFGGGEPVISSGTVLTVTGSGSHTMDTLIVEAMPSAAIPEPVTMLAIGAGLGAVGGYVRRRRRA
jgi:hypothetical protein